MRSAVLETQNGNFHYFPIKNVKTLGFPDPARLPFSIKILLENALRNYDGFKVTEQDIKCIANWTPKGSSSQEIAFLPGRVLMQDFTGVPCVVDLAAMRSAVKRLGGDIEKINPQVRCDLVIDHSLQIDYYGCQAALAKNMDKEFERNQERYEFLKWGQNVFKNFRVVPPGTGIIHQVNLEYLADGILKTERKGQTIIYPDSLVGTDSHTTMINGIGILGWGVGGIEAEAVMLGEAISMLLPEVVGFRLKGKLREGVTATDCVLTIVEILRKKGVVGKFVEYFGPGLEHLTLPDRAMIANMAPEYGATCGLFPVDETTLEYYAMTGRDPKQIDLLEQYMRAQGMFYEPGMPECAYTDVIELDLATIEPSLAGPKRPQDRIVVGDMKKTFTNALTAPVGKTGFGLPKEDVSKIADLGDGNILTNGSVIIASITSCTNTSNPSVLIAAGLIAKKAMELGLHVPSFVKTSLAPGSQVVADYLKGAGLLSPLEALGFHIVGYGCATCIGNSGPIDERIADAISESGIVATSVLSGNRNFEGRVSPHTKANYLASPPLVVAYALAGTVNINLDSDPICQDKDGNDVFLKDLWPKDGEISALIEKYVTSGIFRKRYDVIGNANPRWDNVIAGKDSVFDWSEDSTYIQEPPFFDGMETGQKMIVGVAQARVLAMVGDSITTDHISPAGTIATDSPAGKYLLEKGVDKAQFNSYGSRRGNDRVMTRGTFANIRLRNELAPGTEGSWTTHFPSGEQLSIFDAAQRYKNDNVGLIVIAGKEYGTGSSRDWAAKGTALLGVRAVIAESYERIHRSNLAGMGILPLQFSDGKSRQTLGLTGAEVFDFKGIDETLKPGQALTVTAESDDGTQKTFQVTCRLDTPVEIDYFRNGGILQTVVRKIL